MQNGHQEPGSAGNSLRTVSRWVFFGFVAVGAFFLITEHRAHLFGWLPFLLLAACPFLHLFHHRGHDGGREEPPPGAGPRPDEPSRGDRGAHRH